MWLAALTFVLAGCLSAAGAEVTVYRKVGEEVHLRPGLTLGTSLTSILWKHGSDIAMEMEDGTTDAYRQFKERGTLNASSGVLTIRGLTLEDGGLYRAEINDQRTTPTRLIVLLSVPKPTVSMSCDSTSCTLTCDGDITDSGPVTYTWTLGDSSKLNSSKMLLVTKEDTSAAHEFSCELQNPVSKERSPPVYNPFTSGSSVSRRSVVGVTVFISLLLAVLILVMIHRFKTGMWFFQEASMPWEADFWRRQETSRIPRTDASETNGSSAHPERGQTEEETQMMQTDKSGGF